MNNCWTLNGRANAGSLPSDFTAKSHRRATREGMLVAQLTLHDDEAKFARGLLGLRSRPFHFGGPDSRRGGRRPYHPRTIPPDPKPEPAVAATVASPAEIDRFAHAQGRRHRGIKCPSRPGDLEKSNFR